MITCNCPSCGAPVSFRLKSSVFAVCSYCKSTIVRHDMNLSIVGKMSDLQDDMTPLQIGTRGTYNGVMFEIIGRLKIGYSNGFWNEWYSFFGGEKVGWLAEAQGFYAMCFPFANGNIPTKDSVQPGTQIDLKPEGVFKVEDIRSVNCLFSEGELPLNANKGRQSLSVDLIAANKKMATIEYAEDAVRVFSGSYQDFDSFRFKNLRSIDGW